MRLRLRNWKVAPGISLLETRPLGADRSVAVVGVRGMLCRL